MWVRLVAGMLVFLTALSTRAEFASARVDLGLLTCEVGKGFALIVSKPRDLHCVFHRKNGQTEAYAGKLREAGLTIGASGHGFISWEVLSQSAATRPGALAGKYAGVEIGATAGVGVQGRLLVSERDQSLILQPLGHRGEYGFNIALGIASIELHPLFRAGASSARVRVPAVGHREENIPRAQQEPHYGCGSYTHLQRGQTLSGLARACGVTLEALLDANPQISNVRQLSVGTLVHVPSHVSHRADSPCGDRAILQESESLDDVAWRCGITLHALLMENPTLRDMAMVEPGLVLHIPQRAAPAARHPVPYARTERDFVTHESAGSAPGHAVSRQSTLDRVARVCLRAVARETGEPNVALLREEHSEANSEVVVGVGARLAPWRCLVSNSGIVADISFIGSDGDGVQDVTDSSPAVPAKDDQLTAAAVRACLAAVAKETQERDVTVLSSEYSEANSLVMVGVGAKRAPWRCLSSNDGIVAEVSFTGDDGDGVAGETGAAAPASGDASTAVATRACLAAVAKQTGESDVAVLSTEYSEANSLVMVGIGAQRAPWRCLSSNEGVVAEITSMTNEGE